MFIFHTLAVFSDCWQALINDVINLAKEVSEMLEGRMPEKQVYMSLPRPGVSLPLAHIHINIYQDSYHQAKIL